MMKKNIKPSAQNLEARLKILQDVPGRSLAAAAHGKKHFLNQVSQARLQAERTIPNVPVVRKRSQGIASALFHPTGFFSLGRVILLSLVIFFSGGAATVFASQGSLPGEGLYPLKVFSEDARYFLAFSAEKRLDLTLQYSDRRLNEISALNSQGRIVPQEVLDLYNDELDQGLHIAASLDEQDMLESLQTLSAHADEQLKAMQGLLNDNKSPQALMEMQKHLEDQINAASHGQSDPQGFKQNYNGEKTGNPHVPTLTPLPTGSSPTPVPSTPGNSGNHKPTPTSEPSSTQPKGNSYKPMEIDAPIACS